MQLKPFSCVPHLLPVLWADAGVQWLPMPGHALLWAPGKAGSRYPGVGLCQPANGTPPRIQPQRLPHRLWPRLQNKSLASAQKLSRGFSGGGGGRHSLWSPGSPHLAQPPPGSLSSPLAQELLLAPASPHLQFVLLLDQERKSW